MAAGDPGPAARGGRAAGPDARGLPGRPAARRRPRRPGRTGRRRPGDRPGAGRQAGRRGRATRCSGRCRSRRTCCSGTSTRSPRCRRARCCWPPRRYPNQAFRVGPAAWGLQFHVETTRGDGPRLGRGRPAAADRRRLGRRRAAGPLGPRHLPRGPGRGVAAVRGPVRRAAAAAARRRRPEVPAPRAGGCPGAPGPWLGGPWSWPTGACCGWPGSGSPTPGGPRRCSARSRTAWDLWTAARPGRRRRRRGRLRARPRRRPRPGAAALPRFAGPDLLAALRAEPELRRRLTAVLGGQRGAGRPPGRVPAGLAAAAGAAAAAATCWPRSAPTRPTRRPATAGYTGARRRGRRGADAAHGVPAAACSSLAARDLAGDGRRRRGRRELADLADRDAAGRRSRSPLAELRPGAGAGPARGHRDGQVRRPGAQLRQRRRRRLRRRAGRPTPRATRWPRHPVAAALMRICGAGGLAGRRRAAARGQGRARWCARWPATQAYYQRWASTWEFQALLKARPVAGDPDLGRALRRRARAAGLDGGRAARTSSPTCRRCAAGSSDTSPPDRRDRELKLGPRRPARRRVRGAAAAAGARPRRRVAARRRHAAGARGAVAPAATSAATTRRRSTAPTASCAPSSTGCSCSGCAAPTCCPTTTPSLRWLARVAGLPARRPRRRGATCSTPSWALHAREVRRLHEKLFYRPLLEAVARVPERAAAADARRRPARGWRRSASPTRPARCGTSRRSPPGCRRRAAIQRTLLPVLLAEFADAPDPDARPARLPAGVRRARRHALVPAAAARRGPGGASGWPSCSAPAGTSPSCSPARRRRCGCSPTTPSWRRARGRRAGRRAGRPPAARHDDPGRRSPRAPRRCAARSCSGSPAPTCSAGSTSPRRRGAHRRRRGDPRGRAGRRAAAASPRSPAATLPTSGSRSSAWAGSAAARSATAPTPTCCSCTSRCPGADEEDAAAAAARGRRRAAPAARPRRRPTRRWRSTPTCGPEGRQGPLVRSLAAYGATTRAGRRSGRRRRCCGPVRSPATRSSARGSSRWSTRCATRPAG